MSWHGQINRTLWEVQQQVEAHPDRPRFRRELVRAHFLQRFEYDKAHHIARDDRTFLFLHEQPAPACLLLHGATGTPAEMRELGNHLYQNGISVYCPRLSRVDSKDRLVSWESWATQAETALDTLMKFSEHTFIVGLSLGGTLSMVLSNTKGVSGITLLAPAIYPSPTLKNRLLGLVHLITPTLFYRFSGWNGEMVKAMDAARKNAKRIRVPVLALQAQDDPYLSTRGIKFVRKHARMKHNDIRILDSGGHVITRGPARDEVVSAVADFVHRVAKTPDGERVRATGRPEGVPDTERDDSRRGRSGDGRSRRGGRGRGRRGGADGERDERRAQRSDGERRDNRQRPEGERRDSRSRPEGERRDSRSRPEGERRDSRSRPEGERRDSRSRPEGERCDGRDRPDGESRDERPRSAGKRRGGRRRGGRGRGGSRRGSSSAGPSNGGSSSDGSSDARPSTDSSGSDRGTPE